MEPLPKLGGMPEIRGGDAMMLTASRTARQARLGRHVHLMRTAALAGEAFAPLVEETGPVRRRAGYATVAWAGVALAAGGALLLLV